jgi:hypothetical protein
MPVLAELDVNVPSKKSSEKVRSEEHCPVPCGIGGSLVRFKLLSALKAPLHDSVWVFADHAPNRMEN